MLEVLFQYGPLQIRTWNLFLALAFILSMAFLLRVLPRQKLSVSFLSHHFLALLLGALFIGRLAHVLENFSLFRAHPLKALMIWDFGLSAFGVLYGGTLLLYWSARRAGENFWAWLDAFVLSGILGVAILHIGHFFDGSDYGLPTDLPWGIILDKPGIPFASPLHPTALYSALTTLLLFGILKRLQRKTHLPGIVGNGGIMLYSISALLIDFLHGLPSFYAKVTYAVLAALGFILLIHCSHQRYEDFMR